MKIGLGVKGNATVPPISEAGWSAQGDTRRGPQFRADLHAVSASCALVTPGKLEMLEIWVKEPVDPINFKNQEGEASG